MGIPEHNKYVKMRKNIRENWHHGKWRHVRYLRRKNKDMQRKERIRQILKVEYQMMNSKMKALGWWKKPLPHYIRRYGKYDD